MSLIEDKLGELGIRLEEPKLPVGNYLGTKRAGDLLFVSARVSELKGLVGADVTEEQAKKASRDTVILLLAIVKKDILDLDKIKGVVKVQGFIRSATGFTRQPQVLDGASELLISLFGEHGKHARTATGVNELPQGACIQIDVVMLLKPNS
jgi:enamine deaminase RidA (YjgF/YER057c/UK114 family)